MFTVPGGTRLAESRRVSVVLSFLSSVTRWLFVVVVGCAVLETAQPMNAAEAPSSADGRSADTVIYPKDSPERPASAGARDERGGSSWMLAGAFLLTLGGAWLLLRRRGLTLPSIRAARPERLIVIEETKSLGNRQYLIVAGCGGRRFLLGVTPGRIQRLAALDEIDEDPSAE